VRAAQDVVRRHAATGAPEAALAALRQQMQAQVDKLRRLHVVAGEYQHRVWTAATRPPTHHGHHSRARCLQVTSVDGELEAVRAERALVEAAGRERVAALEQQLVQVKEHNARVAAECDRVEAALRARRVA
jgi:hypothetical protein